MLQSSHKYVFSSVTGSKGLRLASLAIAFGVSSFALGQTGPGKLTPLQIPVIPVVQRSTNLGPTDPNKVIHLAINLLPSNPTGLQAYADSVSEPTSSNYGKFLTPTQFGKMFGQPTSVVNSIVNYLTGQGFKITLVADSHIGILADCTVAQAQTAFNTQINNYHALSAKEPGRLNYFAFAESPQMPASVAPTVLSIEGLQNFTKPQPRATALTPTQTRTLYNTAPIYKGGYQGQARHTAISNWDGFRLTNVPLYYKQFNLPTPPGGVGSNITVVAVAGGSGSGTPAGEGDLDIQMVLGMAPLASFTVYDGGGGLTDVLTKEANDNIADIISESWGWNLPGSDAMAAHNVHLQMTTQGITYMAAAGDSGTQLEPFSYPNYDGEVMMVGGTVASVDSNGNRLAEPSWDGGGGGWSTASVPFNVRPSWQKGKGVPTTINQRLSPDVAFNAAGNNTGAYQFYYNGTLSSDFIGTSFACPVFAGMLTVAEQKVIANGGLSNPPHRFGRIQNLIYSQNGRADVWFDVTQGANGTLPNGQISVATPGWDFASGWGCMNMDAFVKSVSVTPPSVFSPSSASVFNNTFGKSPVVEGTYVSGSALSLTKVDSNNYVISPISETGIGRVGAVEADFATTLIPANVSTLTVSYTAYMPAAGSVMLYIFNRNSGQFELLQTTSATGAATGVTYSFSASKTLGNYVSPTGQIRVVMRSLVPVSKAGTIPSYTFQVDQVQVTATQILQQ